MVVVAAVSGVAVVVGGTVEVVGDTVVMPFSVT